MGRTVFGVFLFTFAAYCFSIGTPFYSSDAQVMYDTARSLAFDGDLWLDEDSLPQIVEGKNGQYVSKYDPGLPLIAVPVVSYGDNLAETHRANRYATAALFVMIIPALAMSLANMGLFLIASRLFSPPRAAIVTLLSAFATIVWPYARLFFAESVLTACLTLAVWGIWTGRIWIASLVVGLGILTRASFAIYIPILLWLAWNKTPRWHVALLLSATVVAVGGLLFHNHLRFGDMWETGYEDEGGFSGTGWLDLLISPGKSIFLYSPPLILSALLWYRFRYKHRVIAHLVLTLFIVAVGFYGAWWAWHGGWVWGPRLLVPIVPLCCLPIGMMPVRWQWLAVTVLVVIFGVAVQITGTFTNVVPHYSSVFQDADPDSPTSYTQIHWQDPPVLAGIQRTVHRQWEPISILRLREVGLPDYWADRVPLAIAGIGIAGGILIVIPRLE